MAKRKRPKDPNQRAKSIVDIATGEVTENDPDEGKDKNVLETKRKSGKQGGQSRAKKLSAKERKEIAEKAARARWDKTEEE